MKFAEYLYEGKYPEADNIRQLVPSIKNGHFTVDASFMTQVSSFDCTGRELTSLIGGPVGVHSDYDCSSNKITSLKGGPSSVGYSFEANSNQITSLEGIHQIIKHVGHFIYMIDNPIKSHVLGLLKIDGLQKVWLDTSSNSDLEKVQNIINKHLKNGKDILDCQEDLIEAGLEEYAQL